MGRIENMFKQMMEKNADLDSQLASHTTSIRNLKVQMWKISQAFNTLPKGALPSDTEEIPQNDVQVHDDVQIDIDDSMDETREEVNPSREHIIDILDPVVQKAKEPLPKPQPPYPQRLTKKNGENQFNKFIQIMKGLSINVPLMEALEQILSYAKFMKDLVTKKRSMNFEIIKVTHQVSAIVYSIDPKLEDPGTFTIPCTIKSADFKLFLILRRVSI
ncbi:uncharacterized protein [Nicotiana tomentosiformis]|uniref:uncharacterized protein n=1 Tax=Nicotiana tomentosiformis TaxID=4098 RepID=UPI00388CA1E2